MVMFQSYYDIENEVVITSKSDEATVNGWCQEINIEEFKTMLEEERKQKKWYRRLVKWLKGKKLWK
jgi:hypothetical protein